MENLLVIGNGFDLNLGLKTRYQDFTESPEYLPLLKDANNVLAQALYHQCKSSNWIDIENELKAHSNEYHRTAQLGDNFKALKQALLNYLKTIDVTSINKKATAYELLDRIAITNFKILDF